MFISHFSLHITVFLHIGLWLSREESLKESLWLIESHQQFLEQSPEQSLKESPKESPKESQKESQKESPKESQKESL